VCLVGIGQPTGSAGNVSKTWTRWVRQADCPWLTSTLELRVCRERAIADVPIPDHQAITSPVTTRRRLAWANVRSAWNLPVPRHTGCRQLPRTHRYAALPTAGRRRARTATRTAWTPPGRRQRRAFPCMRGLPWCSLAGRLANLRATPHGISKKGHARGRWSGRRESLMTTNPLINKGFFWLPRPEIAYQYTTSTLLTKGEFPTPSAGGYRQPRRSGSDRFCDLQRPSLESLGNRVRLPLGPMQVRHDLVGAVVQGTHANSPSMGVLDARLRG